MYAIRYSPNIANDIERGWSAWMGMRYASFAELVATAAEVDQYDFAEWAEARDLDIDAEATAEQYVDDVLGWDVRLDPHTNEVCVVHHDGLSVYKVDEEDLAVNLDAAKMWHAADAASDGFGHATLGSVRVVASFGNWHVLEVENTVREA